MTQSIFSLLVVGLRGDKRSLLPEKERSKDAGRALSLELGIGLLQTQCPLSISAYFHTLETERREYKQG